jgi:hypothetical protein
VGHLTQEGGREIGFNSLLLTLPTEILIKDNVLTKLVSQPTGGNGGHGGCGGPPACLLPQAPAWAGL